jgi:cytoskeletal protein RodZ
LKIEFGTVDSNEMTTIEAASEKKHGWLPILVVLFLISYGLMTMLIVEQGRTIESQRALIHELFKDSSELSAVKTKAEDERAQTAQSQATVARNPSSQNPSTEMQSKRTPSTQAPLNQTPLTQASPKQNPSSQAGAQNTVQNQAAKPKSQVQMPTRQGSDIADSGRSLITI